MKVITAPNKIIENNKPTIFLAGGITNCDEWQDKLIQILQPYDFAILLNPRRRNFPIHDKNAAQEQIEWEYNALNNADVFTMWFSASPVSVQPICMYEYGRHLAIRQYKKELHKVVVGVEEGYLRKQDVYIQTKLIDTHIRINNNTLFICYINL
jgi:hypothetical protein